MSQIEKVLSAYPAQTGLRPRLLADAVDKLYECAGVCLACADACSAEQDPQMIAMSAKCMRMDHDCSDLCTVAARVLTRQTGYDAPTTMAVIEAVRAALRACADACAEMQDMEHCQVTAQVCRQTEEFLGELVQQMQSGESGDAYPDEPPSATAPAGAAMAESDS
jgi:hypothetical protein